MGFRDGPAGPTSIHAPRWRSIHPGLQSRRFRHHRGPTAGRTPAPLGLAHGGNALDLVAHVLTSTSPMPQPGAVRVIFTSTVRVPSSLPLHLQLVDESKVHDVDRDFRVEAAAHLLPGQFSTSSSVALGAVRRPATPCRWRRPPRRRYRLPSIYTVKLPPSAWLMNPAWPGCNLIGCPGHHHRLDFALDDKRLVIVAPHALLGGNLVTGRRVGQRGIERVPAQAGAFHACRKFAHA